MVSDPRIEPLLPVAQALRQVRHIETRSFSAPWTMAQFRFLAADERSIQVGLWRCRQLVGYAMALVEDEDCHLINLAVDTPFRRQGWGRRLVVSIADLAQQRDSTTCHLEVRRSNEAALRLYASLGFQQVEVLLRYYTQPTEDACLMQCPLPLPAAAL